MRRGFIFYDFNKPLELSEDSRDSTRDAFHSQDLRGAFDFVLIDPPFITREVFLTFACLWRQVWEKYAMTARASLSLWSFKREARLLGAARSAPAVHHHCGERSHDV